MEIFKKIAGLFGSTKEDVAAEKEVVTFKRELAACPLVRNYKIVGDDSEENKEEVFTLLLLLIEDGRITTKKQLYAPHRFYEVDCKTLEVAMPDGSRLKSILQMPANKLEWFIDSDFVNSIAEGAELQQEWLGADDYPFTPDSFLPKTKRELYEFFHPSGIRINFKMSD